MVDVFNLVFVDRSEAWAGGVGGTDPEGEARSPASQGSSVAYAFLICAVTKRKHISALMRPRRRLENSS